MILKFGPGWAPPVFFSNHCNPRILKWFIFRDYWRSWATLYPVLCCITSTCIKNIGYILTDQLRHISRFVQHYPVSPGRFMWLVFIEYPDRLTTLQLLAVSCVSGRPDWNPIAILRVKCETLTAHSLFCSASRRPNMVAASKITCLYGTFQFLNGKCHIRQTVYYRRWPCYSSGFGCSPGKNNSISITTSEVCFEREFSVRCASTTCIICCD